MKSVKQLFFILLLMSNPAIANDSVTKSGRNLIKSLKDLYVYGYVCNDFSDLAVKIPYEEIDKFQKYFSKRPKLIANQNQLPNIKKMMLETNTPENMKIICAFLLNKAFDEYKINTTTYDLFRQPGWPIPPRLSDQ